MDIIKERLWREYNMETIFTTPTVTYLVKTRNLKDDRILSQMNIKELYKSRLWQYIVTSDTKELIKPDEHKIKSHEEKIHILAEELKPWLLIKS